MQLLDRFKYPKSDHKEAADIKIGTIYCQGTIEGESLMLQLCGQTKTKNMSTDLNDRLIEMITKAVQELIRKGYDVEFVSSSIDGVSCGTKFA